MNILHIFTKQRLIGNIGERAVCKHLKRRGYKILKTNYVECGHEIDIIAENKEYICFTEVKTRTVGHEDSRESRPAAAVNKRKQLSIISASRLFCEISRYKNKKFRFDVAEVFLNEKKKTEKR